MKISVELDEQVYTFETDRKSSRDLYHMIMHFKGLLLGMGYDLEKIDGCFKGAVDIKFTHG